MLSLLGERDHHLTDSDAFIYLFSSQACSSYYVVGTNGNTMVKKQRTFPQRALVHWRERNPNKTITRELKVGRGEITNSTGR